MADRCFYFGCWNEAGHYMHGPGDREEKKRLSYLDAERKQHIDGSLAPREARPGTRPARLFGAGLIWSGKHHAWQTIDAETREYPQGQFLLHHLDTGFTAIQWWDRTQGDTRPGCNGTILLEGRHTSAEMLAALAEHFPHVLANLRKAGVELIEVKIPEPGRYPIPTIDESDGDFALLSSTGAKGIAGVILLLLALVLYLIAASNSSECERHECPEGQKAS